MHAPDKMQNSQAYRDYAEALRVIAGHMELEESRRSLLRIADEFEQIATANDLITRSREAPKNHQ
jgi:hypothetical protein